MDDYIKTIINGLKAWVSATVNRLERSIARVDFLLDSKVGTIDPVFKGAFSQNRKADTEIGANSHAEGINTTASGLHSHAEGIDTTASGKDSHAEGSNTTASGICSHAEGSNTTASSTGSHAEGMFAKAIGICSHAEGSNTTASGKDSHAEGYRTIASGEDSHVQGKCNIEDTEGKYAHIVGNGIHASERANAHTLDWNGTPWYQGRPQFGGNAQDDGAQTVMANGDTEITLKSPAGKLYKITVSDDGTLTTTEVTT